MKSDLFMLLLNLISSPFQFLIKQLIWIMTDPATTNANSNIQLQLILKILKWYLEFPFSCYIMWVSSSEP